MKRNWILAAMLLLFTHANALIVSIDGYGDIPENGLEITLTQAEMDIATGEMQMELQGSLLCTAPLNVSILRSATGLSDEFCCTGACTAGNGETSQTLNYSPAGPVDWFIHYYPAANSDETIVYTFTDADESRTLTVHFQYSTEGIDPIIHCPSSTRKILHNGMLYIEQEGKIYDAQGNQISIVK